MSYEKRLEEQYLLGLRQGKQEARQGVEQAVSDAVKSQLAQVADRQHKQDPMLEREAAFTQARVTRAQDQATGMFSLAGLSTALALHYGNVPDQTHQQSLVEYLLPIAEDAQQKLRAQTVASFLEQKEGRMLEFQVSGDEMEQITGRKGEGPLTKAQQSKLHNYAKKHDLYYTSQHAEIDAGPFVIDYRLPCLSLEALRDYMSLHPLPFPAVMPDIVKRTPTVRPGEPPVREQMVRQVLSILPELKLNKHRGALRLAVERTWRKFKDTPDAYATEASLKTAVTKHPEYPKSNRRKSK